MFYTVCFNQTQFKMCTICTFKTYCIIICQAGYYDSMTICDAIKQTESELEKNQNSVPFPLYEAILGLYYAANHNKIEHMVPEIAILVMLKTIQYKGNCMLSKSQY